MSTLVWFRQDLRLHDNPALLAAVRRGAAVIPVYVLDDAAEGRWAPGGASRSWLHRSLAALGALLDERQSRLILRRGDAGTHYREREPTNDRRAARISAWKSPAEPTESQIPHGPP